MVYLILSEDQERIKIGYTATPKSRMSALRREHGDIALVGTLPGGRFVERHLHAEYRPDRAGGEWFYRSQALDAFIASLPKPDAARHSAKDEQKTPQLNVLLVRIAQLEDENRKLRLEVASLGRGTGFRWVDA